MKGNRMPCENQDIATFEVCGKYDIPVLRGGDYELDGVQFIGFNSAKKEKERFGKGLHFFEDDYRFDRLWRSPLKYLRLIEQYSVVMTPDYSLYINDPVALQIYNHYKKHWLGALWQSMGCKVIPTITWGDPKSFEWCFDGEPKNSIIAVSSVGMQQGRLRKNLFDDGWNEMLLRLEPKTIIFHGIIPEKCRECNAKIIEIETFTKKFEKMKNGGMENG